MEMPNTILPRSRKVCWKTSIRSLQQNSTAPTTRFILALRMIIWMRVLKTDATKVCGLKIFMGSSTGNLLVDDPKVLEQIFSRVPFLIASHCEDEPTIRRNTEEFRNKYGEDLPMEYHPLIRSEEACYKSSLIRHQSGKNTAHAFTFSTSLLAKKRCCSMIKLRLRRKGYRRSPHSSFVV